MQAGTKVAGWGGALVAIAVVVFIMYHYVMSSALSTDCRNSTIEEVRSPDGAYVATVFDRNCGATTPYYRVVSLRFTGSKFDQEMQDDWIFEVKNKPEILLKWADPRHLSVRSYWNDENPTPRTSWRDVSILRESQK